MKLLHIDDNYFHHEKLKAALSKSKLSHYDLVYFSEPKKLYSHLEKHPADIVFLDIHLGPEQEPLGVSIAKSIIEKYPKLFTVMLSVGLEFVKSTMLLGVNDFISKDQTSEEMSSRLNHTLALYHLKNKSQDHQLEEKNNESNKELTSIVGKTMKSVYERVPRILDSAIRSVHIFGESGVGKEKIVDIFEHHLPSNTPLLRLNCGALSSNLIESELFGHVKGAFTGANQDKIGVIEAASGGWLFLDEIANLGVKAQMALLRVIENQQLVRLGDNKTRKVDVKVISAANESLDQLVHDNRFRLDLQQRLIETKIDLPPLRERKDEIKLLTLFFAKQEHGGPYTITPAALSILEELSWEKGNIRQLRNCIRAMTEFHIEKCLSPISIPTDLFQENELVNGKCTDSFQKHKQDTNADASEIKIPWQADIPFDFEYYSDQLLLQMIERIIDQSDASLSLRNLSTMLNINRAKLSKKLKKMILESKVNAKLLNSFKGLQT